MTRGGILDASAKDGAGTPSLGHPPSFLVKIADFGLASGGGGGPMNESDLSLQHTGMRTSQRTNTGAGTLAYKAPELYRNAPYTASCEVFAFGIVAFEVATGLRPWAGLNEASLLMALVVEKQRPPLTPHQAVSVAGQLAASCWGEDPEGRPSFEGLRAQLEEQRAVSSAIGCTRQAVAGLAHSVTAALGRQRQAQRQQPRKHSMPSRMAALPEADDALPADAKAKDDADADAAMDDETDDEEEDDSSGDDDDRFSARLLVFGRMVDAALGIHHFLDVEQNALRQGMLRGVEAIREEFEARGTAEDIECMRYVLDEAAGSSPKTFPNARAPRDCNDHGEVLADRLRPDGTPMRLRDFLGLPAAVMAKLELAHVAALRIYSTAAYKTLNSALRDPHRRARGEAHPLSVTVAFISAAVGSLRAVEAMGPDATKTVDLYRGMRDVAMDDGFMAEGGSEYAPMSTTSDFHTAVTYSASRKSVLLRLRTRSSMERGADLTFLSCFPGEKEYLFPPLCALRCRWASTPPQPPGADHPILYPLCLHCPLPSLHICLCLCLCLVLTRVCVSIETLVRSTYLHPLSERAVTLAGTELRVVEVEPRM